MDVRVGKKMNYFVLDAYMVLAGKSYLSSDDTEPVGVKSG